MLDAIADFLSKPLVNENINITSMMVGFALSAFLSFLLSLIYKRLNPEREEIHLMMQSLVVLSMTIAAAMMIVGNELARAFGLVGAVSVIRFRTAVQNYRDMAFVFISIVIGMACGLEFYILAAFIALSTGGLLFLLGVMRFGERKRQAAYYALRIGFNCNGISRTEIENELLSRKIPFTFCGMKMAEKKSWFDYRIEACDKALMDEVVAFIKKRFSDRQVIIRINIVKR
ncbi:MAG: DUF4956 domain-containing protein [Spirochaetales bacterium]|nr:DUF4956 domain-containing protein [Spirochaetales bacterium]